MARFAINSADGQSIRYTGCPTYNGTYLKPSFLEFREIASPTPIDWQVGDYVDYTSDDKCTRTGYRYKLYDIPQPTKKAAVSEYEGAIVYQNVQFFAPTKDLELCPFRDIVLADNNIHFSTRDDVSTFEPLSGIVTRLQANLDDWYGEGVWEIRIASGLPSELVAAISEAREFSVAGGSVLDAINKCYDIFDNIGWRFSVEDDVNVLTFGAANVTPDATNTTPTMKYGFAPDGSRNGLNTIGKTQSNKDEFATRLYAYGSSRNMNFQYYRGDAEIKDAESLDIEHLMIPKEYWGLTDGKYDARKAFLANQAVELAWGKRAKYHYFDGSEDDEIYPSLEGMTIGHIREVKEEMEDTEYVPSETIYTDEDERVDYPKAVVNPADDGVYNRGTSEDIKKGTLNDGITASWYSTWGAGTNWSHTMPTNFGTIELPLVSADYRVTLGAGYGGVVSWNSGRFAQDVFYVNLLVKRTRIVGGTSSEETIGNIPLTIGRGYLDFTFELSDSRTYELVTGGEGVTRDYLSFEIQAGTTGVLPDSDIRMNLSVTNHEISYTLKKFFAEDFTLTLKQIGFSINDRQALGGNGLATVFFNEGMCAGRSFVVKSCEYQSATDDWKLVCTRAYDESTGMAYPNDSYKITTSDRFVLLDIAMPDLYIKVAEERLYARASALLADISRIKPAYSPSIDAQMLAGNPFAIEEGMFMALQDTEVTGGSVEKIIIDSITISESEAAIPTYKVTLREEKGKTFRNGLNSGAVSSTPLTSAKTGEGSGASMNVSGGLASLTVGSVSAVLTTSQWVLGRGFITSQDLSPYRTAEEQNIIDAGKEDKHPYISLERLDKYLYRVTFDALPEDNGGDNPVSGGCSSYVKDGKLYRNLDFNYDNAASFEVHTRDFVGMSFITGLNDGEMDNEKIAQLPYRIVDGRNNHGIMVSTHVLFNDWNWTGAGDRSISLTRLPFLVLSRVKSMATIADDLDGVLDNLYASAALQATEYLIQVLVTDGTTSYALMPPTSAGQSYVLQNISTYPKLANFRWVNRATVVRTESDIQRRPTGIERYNAMPCPLEDLRFTKCYENTDRLSEFIGIDGTTKSSTDAQLTVVYNKARAEYLQRKRDGVTWQTMHSVVYGDGMESLYIQENWNDACNIAHSHANKTSVLDKLKWDAANNAIYIGDADNPINFYAFGNVSAGGVGSGGGSTGGVASLLLNGATILPDADGKANLGSLTTATDFDALEERVTDLEEETPHVSFGTAGADYIPLTVNSVTKNLLTAHQSLAAYRTSANQDIIDNAIKGRLTTIEGLIPSAATTSNPLADKAFVNSSISTATATFRGTSATGLTEAQFLAWANGLTKDNNDYVFWNTTDSAGNVQFKRYKYNGTSWEYEYTLNNSSFTSAQWAAINSGLTSSDKTALNNALALIATYGNIVTHNAEDFATAAQGAKADSAYQKPSTGIPYADLASGVKDSLDLADSALQSHQTIYALTIQKNGATVDTYTPNSAAKTINITDVASAQTLSDLKTWIESMFEKDTTSIAGTTLIKAKFGLYSEQDISAGGIGQGGSSGGGIASIVLNGNTILPDTDGKANLGSLATAAQHNALADDVSDIDDRVTVLEGKATAVSYTPAISSGTALGTITIDSVGHTIYAPTIPTSLKNPYSLTFGSKTYDGSTAKTITASDLGALTSHQSVTLASGTNNGTLKLTTNAGTVDNIAVKGLGSLAYKSGLVEGDIPTLAISKISGLQSALDGKQGTISDLSTIRARADEGHTAYGWGNHASAGYLKAADLTNIENGIKSLQSQIDSVSARDSFDELTASALFADVLTASSAYFGSISVEGGIPKSALASAVQTSLGRADSALQSHQSVTLVSGTNNGTLKLTTAAGVVDNIAVKGLAALAFKASLVASDIPSLDWSKITTGKPTTISGYGITDAYTKTQVDAKDITAVSLTASKLTLTRTNGNLEATVPTWNQDTTGNAATATKLKTARSIWGQNFDGTTAISGNMSGVGTINFTGKATDEIGLEIVTVGGVRYLHTTLPFYSDSDISAGGVGSGGSGGGGIASIILNNNTILPDTDGKANLGSLATAAQYNSLAGRVTTLEGKATAVSYTPTITSGTTLGTITIDSVGHTIYAPTIPTALKNPTALSWSGYSSGSYDGSVAKSISIPTTLPASDVYAWAKAANKPSYAFSEITGTANTAQIPSLSASKITSGTFATDRIPTLAIAKISGLQDALDSKVDSDDISAVGYSGDYSDLLNKPTIVNTIGGKSGTIGIGSGLSVTSTNTLTNTGVLSIISLTGAVSQAQLRTALGLGSAAYTESSAYAAASHTHSQYITGITSSMVIAALGYTPYNSSNPAGYLVASDLANIEKSIQSLQSQVDSVSARDGFDELYATSLFADTLVGTNIYGALHGNADSATNADTLDGQHGSYYATAASVSTLQGYFTNGVANNADKLDGIHANGLFTALSSNGSTNLSVTIGGTTKTTALYATYDSASENISDKFGIVGQALQSLQSQIDSVACARNFDELILASLFSDMISAENVYANGFYKSGSSNSYVLLGGGGHKAESSLSVASAVNATNLTGGTVNATTGTFSGTLSAGATTVNGNATITGAAVVRTNITMGGNLICTTTTQTIGTSDKPWGAFYGNKWYPNANDTTNYIEYTNGGFLVHGNIVATGNVAAGA